MRNNPDDLSNQLIAKIETWLRGEISDVRSSHHDDEVDSRELGILDGRYECAEALQTKIKEWKKELFDG
jgi:hypothetical protein|tara:strand:+ start:17 stop:223 length:207 start_codon:yes stop_codon:yes gene_type:complete